MKYSISGLFSDFRFCFKTFKYVTELGEVFTDNDVCYLENPLYFEIK